MGQSSSTAGTLPVPNYRESNLSRRFSSRSTAAICPTLLDESSESLDDVEESHDYISDIPDECLAYIFQSLSSGDRKRCSLVCQRWLRVEGQSRQRLSLNAQSEIIPHLPSIFTRFDSVKKLALRCDRRSVSLNDDSLVLISIHCRNLTRLKLRGCREVTDIGMAKFAKNCKTLKKFSCGSCMFGAKGMNAVLDHCSALEELSVKRLRAINDGGAAGIGPGAAASSLKVITLKELYAGQCFEPLITGSKKLKTLKLFRCLGDWDKLLKIIGKGNSNLVEIHLERLQVSDTGLSAIANCSNLEILHIAKTPECTNFGLISVAENCKLLRKLHIDGWRTNRIGDEGLISVAKHCPNLQELVLIGVNSTATSLVAIASQCQNLERLALCGSETIRDGEILFIAEKCVALRKLCIKGCPITDVAMETLAWGFPNLVKVKVKKCRAVSSQIADLLRAKRGSLIVNLDVDEIEAMDASGSDVGAQEIGMDFPPPPLMTEITDADPPSRSGVRSTLFRAKFGLFAGRSLMPCPFRRWSNSNTSSSN